MKLLSCTAAVQFILLLTSITPPYLGNAKNIVLNPISPPPSQCSTFTFHWTGGVPPFFVYIVQQGDSQQQRTLGPTNDTHFTWGSDFPAGTILQADVFDSTSHSGESGPFTMRSGTSNGCLGGSLTSIVPTPSIASIETVPGSTSTITRTLALPTTIFLSSPLSMPQAPPQLSSYTSQEIETDPSLGTGSKPQTTTYPETTTCQSSLATPAQIDSANPNALSFLPATTSASSYTIASPGPLSPQSNPTIVSHPLPSTLAQQAVLPKPSRPGRVAGITIGCLIAALLALLAICFLQKRRRAKMRARVTSMTTLDTLAFTGRSSLSCRCLK